MDAAFYVECYAVCHHAECRGVIVTLTVH